MFSGRARPFFVGQSLLFFPDGPILFLRRGPSFLFSGRSTFLLIFHADIFFRLGLALFSGRRPLSFPPGPALFSPGRAHPLFCSRARRVVLGCRTLPFFPARPTLFLRPGPSFLFSGRPALLCVFQTGNVSFRLGPVLFSGLGLGRGEPPPSLGVRFHKHIFVSGRGPFFFLAGPALFPRPGLSFLFSGWPAFLLAFQPGHFSFWLGPTLFYGLGPGLPRLRRSILGGFLD